MKKFFFAIVLVVITSFTATIAVADEKAWVKAEKNTVFVTEDSSILWVVSTGTSSNLSLARDKARLAARRLLAEHLGESSLRAGAVEFIDSDIVADGRNFKVLVWAAMSNE